jgi:hypothetical protein
MSHQTEPQKEMYQTPMLSILGDIREVTKTTNMGTGSLDGSMDDKTGPMM